MFLAIRKQPIKLDSEYELPCPMSHLMDTECEVKEWLFARGMRAQCNVIGKGRFDSLAPIKSLNAWALSKPLVIAEL